MICRKQFHLRCQFLPFSVSTYGGVAPYYLPPPSSEHPQADVLQQQTSSFSRTESDFESGSKLFLARVEMSFFFM
jgi:hypothetical protein